MALTPNEIGAKLTTVFDHIDPVILDLETKINEGTATDKEVILYASLGCASLSINAGVERYNS